MEETSLIDTCIRLFPLLWGLLDKRFFSIGLLNFFLLFFMCAENKPFLHYLLNKLKKATKNHIPLPGYPMVRPLAIPAGTRGLGYQHFCAPKKKSRTRPNSLCLVYSTGPYTQRGAEGSDDPPPHLTTACHLHIVFTSTNLDFIF